VIQGRMLNWVRTRMVQLRNIPAPRGVAWPPADRSGWPTAVPAPGAPPPPASPRHGSGAFERWEET
jgi:hypothetical protein